MSWLDGSNITMRNSIYLMFALALAACSYKPPPELDEIKKIYGEHKKIIHDVKNICQSRSGNISNFRVERSAFGTLFDPHVGGAPLEFSKQEADIIHHAFDDIRFDRIYCGYNDQLELSLMALDFYGKRTGGYADYSRTILWSNRKKNLNPFYIKLDDSGWYIDESDTFRSKPEKPKPPELPASEFQSVGAMDFWRFEIHGG